MENANKYTILSTERIAMLNGETSVQYNYSLYAKSQDTANFLRSVHYLHLNQLICYGSSIEH